NLLDEVARQLRIGIRETWCPPSKAAFSDEVTEQPDLTQLEGLVGAEAAQYPGDRDAVTDDDVMQRLPATCGQEWMVACHLAGPSATGCDLEARLDAAVDPR